MTAVVRKQTNTGTSTAPTAQNTLIFGNMTSRTSHMWHQSMLTKVTWAWSWRLYGTTPARMLLASAQVQRPSAWMSLHRGGLSGGERAAAVRRRKSVPPHCTQPLGSLCISSRNKAIAPNSLTEEHIIIFSHSETSNDVLTCIQEASDSNLGRGAEYPDVSLEFSSVLPGKCNTILKVGHGHFIPPPLKFIFTYHRTETAHPSP